MNKISLPFGWKLYVFICKKDELNKKAKKIKINFTFDKGEEHKIGGIAEFIKQESPREDVFVMWVNSEKAKGLNYKILHEIHHIVFIYCQHLEIEDEEFRAYLFEDICRKLKLFNYIKKKSSLKHKEKSK